MGTNSLSPLPEELRFAQSSRSRVLPLAFSRAKAWVWGRGLTGSVRKSKQTLSEFATKMVGPKKFESPGTQKVRSRESSNRSWGWKNKVHVLVAGRSSESPVELPKKPSSKEWCCFSCQASHALLATIPGHNPAMFMHTSWDWAESWAESWALLTACKGQNLHKELFSLLFSSHGAGNQLGSLIPHSIQ